MIFIGILLIIVAAVLGTLLFLGTAQLTDPVQVGVLGGTLELPPLSLVIAGAIIVVLLWLGWVTLRVGIRRASRRRKDAKENARLADEQRKQQEREMQEGFAQREAALADERRQREEEAAALRTEAEARVAEQHEATETARRRAEVAERRLDTTQQIPPQ